jgi:tellurite resistance protein
MNADDLRCTNDLSLFERLLQDSDVKDVNEALAEAEEKGPAGIRRQLLATSVRLTRRMSPAVHEMLDDCVAKLGVDIPIELYVYASPQFNAACVKPEEGRLFIMFSSSLLESFKGSELRFVIGHELGHHIYQHHDIPIGYILRGRHRPNPKLALELFAWSRYAEISADRAGAHCAQDLQSVGRALFRLTSGLSDEVISFDLDEFLEQVDDMQAVDAEPGQGAPTADWFSTHPFSPLRVRALKLFHQSEFATDGKMPAAELEVGVQRLLALMEPNYLEGKTDTAETMRRLFFAAALVIANASDGISEEEIQVFEQFVGEGSYTGKVDLEQLENELPERVQKTVEVTSPTQRMRVLQDLAFVSRADGHPDAAERAVMLRLARDLEVHDLFVDQCLACSMELD